MSAIVFFKGIVDEVKKIFTFGDDKVANVKKVALNTIGASSLAASAMTPKMGVNTYYFAPAFFILSILSFFASYKIVSKNKEADKSKMKYKDYPISEEHKKAIDLIVDGISLGRDGISFSTLKRITSLAPSLYSAGDKIRYREAQGKIYGVQTLRNLGYILSDKTNRERLKVVMNYSGLLKIVKTTYIKQMSEALDRLNETNLIVPYLNDFVDEVTSLDNVSKSNKKELVDKLTTLVKSNNPKKWEEVINTFVK